MGSLFNPSIRFTIGFMLFPFLYATSEQVLIDFGQRQTTRWIDQIDSARYVIYRKWRSRCISSLEALSTTRSKEGFITCSEILGPSPTFSGTPIRDVWPYICRRLLGSERIFFNLPSDQTPHRGSRHFSGYYFQAGAPRDQLIPVRIQTPDQ